VNRLVPISTPVHWPGMGDVAADLVERATNGSGVVATSSPWRWLSQVCWMFEAPELDLVRRADAILQKESVNLHEGSQTLLEAKYSGRRPHRTR
jgi:hypothetical protein